VGVRCDGDVAEARGVARGDRSAGMASLQADHVHVGIEYDVEVDTTRSSTEVCVHSILDAMS
jgi:chloramphenicol 3-O phosphotransferase